MAIQHKDIPDANLHEVKGAASASIGQILTATGAGTATFQTSAFTTTSQGFWDYNDTGTASAPIALSLAGVDYQLTNNGLGANTLKTYKLGSITDIYNVSTNYFDFSPLKLGDTVDIRVDVEVTTASANNVVDIGIEMSVGATPYKLYTTSRYLKTAGTYKIVCVIPVYIGNTNAKNYPARIIAKCDSTGAVLKVNGWYTRVITNG